VDLLELQRYSAILNCSLMVIPFNYLEIPIGGNHWRKVFWQGVIDKIKKKKLSRWKKLKKKNYLDGKESIFC